MHGSAAMAHPLTLSVADAADKLPPAAGVEVVLCPPFTLLSQVATWLVGSAVRLGAQDCHAQPEGAHTGDISAPMLKDAGCSYVIVGHSERRQNHGETDKQVHRKAAQIIKQGLIPIICIGETADERKEGLAEERVGRQLRDSLPPEAHSGDFVLAYEPVWAIGSGQTPTADDIRRMHAYIKATVAAHTGLPEARIRVLYGGSVKGDNAEAILAIDGVFGVLVGGASLKAEEFSRIINAAA